MPQVPFRRGSALTWRARPLARWVFGFSLLGALATANAATLTVTTLADSGPGSLRATIAAAQVDDAIFFAPTLEGTINLATTLEIDGTLSIDGDHRIALDGGDSVRVMTIGQDATVTLRHLTIQRGFANYGGGIDNRGRLTLDECVVRDNHAFASGGGLRHGGFRLTVIGGSIDDNGSELGGGGAFIEFGLDTSFTRTRITGNLTSFLGGAGIQHASTDPISLDYVTIAGNATVDAAQGNGGGVRLADGTMFVRHSTISTNQAIQGGGIYVEPSSTGLEVTDSVIARNTSRLNGGGIYLRGAALTMRNATVSGNIAQIGGAGMYMQSDSAAATADVRFATFADNVASGTGGGIIVNSGTLTLANSLIANNGAISNFDLVGTMNSLGYNQVTSRGTSSGYVATDLPPGSQLFLGALGFYGGPTNTHYLGNGSVARDAVPAVNCADTPADQRGFARIPGQPCDIGAYDADALFLSENVFADGFE